MDHIDHKRDKMKTESLERAKSHLKQRTSFSPKPEIGDPCPKFQTREEQHRLNTHQQNNLSYSQLGQSYLNYSNLRASQSFHNHK